MKKKKNKAQIKQSMLAEQPKAFLYIPSDIYGQILGYCVGCSVEISGMGQLKPYNDGYIVTKIHLPKQQCSGVETEMDADELGVLEYECEDGEFKDDGELIWWWHSHVDMGTFWSVTDHNAIDQLAAHGRVVATVFNRKFSMKTAYKQAASDDGFYPPVFSDDLVTVIIPSSDIEQHIEDKVSEQERIITTYKGSKPPAFNNWHTNCWADEEPIYKTAIDDQLDMMTAPTEDISPDTIEIQRRDRHIDWLVMDFNINEVMADDLCDDFDDTFGREPESYLELKSYAKANYQFTTIEEA